MSITLPGTYEGLLQYPCPILERGATGVYLGPDRPERDRHFVHLRLSGQHGSVPLANLRLDLAHEAGRARARNWAAAQLGCRGGGLSWWLDSWAGEPIAWVLSRPDSAVVPNFSARFWCGDGRAPVKLSSMGRVVLVPALAGVDPRDRSLLPDGSKRCAALALAVACKHLHQL